ncbi:unnamed protein product [Closterium sp. NIES-53]
MEVGFYEFQLVFGDDDCPSVDRTSKGRNHPILLGYMQEKTLLPFKWCCIIPRHCSISQTIHFRYHYF